MRHPKATILFFVVVGWLTLSSWHGSRNKGDREAGPGFHLGSTFSVLGKDVAIEFSVRSAGAQDDRVGAAAGALTLVSCALEPGLP